MDGFRSRRQRNSAPAAPVSIIDWERIKEANANAKAAGVTDKVKFIQGNLFEVERFRFPEIALVPD